MKRLKLNFIVVAGLSFCLFAFIGVREGGIQGRISPVEGAAQVLAISGRDTLRTTVNNGTFVFSKVKAQTYTLLVKGNPPFKDTFLENVAVVDSATTDVGEIKLLQ